MSTHFQKLWSYHIWGWEQVWQSLQATPAVEYFAERPLFWHSLHGLTAHCLAADTIWLQRCLGQSPTKLPGAADFATLVEVLEAWPPVLSQWATFLQEQPPAAFDQPVVYRDTTGREHHTLLTDLVTHVVNHGTEHRSQMTPVLYHLGHPTQMLDYIAYCRLQA